MSPRSTHDTAERRVTQIVETTAAFDVAPADVEEDVAGRRIAATPGVQLVGRQERIVAVDDLVAEERRLTRARRR